MTWVYEHKPHFPIPDHVVDYYFSFCQSHSHAVEVNPDCTILTLKTKSRELMIKSDGDQYIDYFISDLSCRLLQSGKLLLHRYEVPMDRLTIDEIHSG